jgi:hypothetical protein
MDSPIDDAIAEAKAQAARLPAIVPVRKLSMSDLEASSLDVESWLQVDKYGLHLDKSQEALEAIEVEIDVGEIVPVYMVRFGKNPPNYCRSYNGITTFGSPKPWEFTLREAQNLDADCRGQYPAVEIPMTLIDGVELKRDRKTIEGGTRIGYTTSITGYCFSSPWRSIGGTSQGQVPCVLMTSSSHASVPVLCTARRMRSAAITLV